MSRGPGRVQRAILVELARPDLRGYEKPCTYRLPEDADDGWVSPGIRRLGVQRVGELTAHQIAGRLSDAGWWWGENLDRQVRRALDRLTAAALVEKRLVENYPHYPDATRALWWLAGTEPQPRPRRRVTEVIGSDRGE